MDLKINNSSINYNLYTKYQGQKPDSSYSVVQNSPFMGKKSTKSCDGKFSFSEAAKNFAKGIVSPITNMFASVQNFAIGAGMIVGSMALIAATAGAAAPVLVAVGLGLGTVQAGKAVYKVVTAKNPDDVEKAFYNLGEATSAVGLSAIGAKTSLRQANFETEGLSVLNAVKKCFTSSKDLIKESFNVFKSGYFKTNFKGAFRVVTQPGKLRKYSRELYIEGKNGIYDALDSLRAVLPEKFRSYLVGRNKCEVAIYDKMIKARTTDIDTKIRQVKDNPVFSSEVKKQKTEQFLADRKKMSTDPNYAKGKVQDLYGIRNTKDINGLVDALAEAAKKGDIQILEIENYRAANLNYNGQTDFYLSEQQIEQLCTNKLVKTTVKNLVKDSGYTSSHIKIKTPNGKVFELQLRGEEIDKVSNWEHIPYDLEQGKDIAKGNNKLGMLLSATKKAIGSLSKEQHQKYQEYIYDNYVYAQAKEFGKTSVKPTLPEGVNPILSAENLEALYLESIKFKPGSFNNPFEITPQLAWIAGVESHLDD